MLYSRVAPSGAVITIVPVATEQDGCTVTLAVAAAGALAAELTVNEVAAETHVGSVVLLTVTAYVFGTSPAKVVPDW